MQGARGLLRYLGFGLLVLGSLLSVSWSVAIPGLQTTATPPGPTAGREFPLAWTLQSGFNSLQPSRRAQLLIAEDRSYSIDNLLDPATRAAWQPAAGRTDFGDVDGSVWLRFDVQGNEHTSPPRVLLEVAAPMLDELDVYMLHGNTLLRTWQLGDMRPRGNRPLFHRNIVVPIDFLTLRPQHGQRSLTLYLRARSEGNLQLPVRLWEPEAFARHEARALGGRGLAYGALFILCTVFLFASFTAGARGFGFYVAHALCLAAYQGMSDGMIGQYLSIDGDWWSEHGISIIGWATLATGALFAAVILDAEHRMPRIDRWLDAVVISSLLGLAASLVAPAHLIFPLLAPMAVLYGVIMPAIGIYAMRHHIPLAAAYTAGTLCLLIGIEMSLLNQFGFIERRLVDGDATLIGMLLQALILAWALTQHLSQAREQRLRAQEDALARQEEALEAQQRLTQALEARVGERSNALWQAVRQLESANRQLSALSRQDGLTGIHNRRYFEERYPELVRLASRQKQPLAVMLLDADHFKKLNDTHGHATGDECLRQISSAIQQVVSRSTDLIARYGGEEFVVVLPETGIDGAYAVAEKLRETVNHLHVSHDGADLHFSVSVGVAICTPSTGSEGGELLAHADEALYRAKHKGRNRVEVHAA